MIKKQVIQSPLAKRDVRSVFKPNTILFKKTKYTSEFTCLDVVYEIGERDGNKLQVRELSNDKKPIKQLNGDVSEWQNKRPKGCDNRRTDGGGCWQYHKPTVSEYYEFLGRDKLFEFIEKWRRNGFIINTSLCDVWGGQPFKTVYIEEHEEYMYHGGGANDNIHITEYFSDSHGSYWFSVSSEEYDNDISDIDFDFYELFTSIDNKLSGLSHTDGFNQPTEYDYFISNFTSPSPYTQLMAKMWVNEGQCKWEYKNWYETELAYSRLTSNEYHNKKKEFYDKKSEIYDKQNYGHWCFLHDRTQLPYTNEYTPFIFCETHYQCR